METREMETEIFNPYQDMAIVRDPEMFFGHALLLKRIYPAILRHQSLSLIGSRRSGKSSLLKHLPLRLTQQQFAGNRADLSHFLFVTINFSEHLQETSDDFLLFVSQQIAFQYQQQEGHTLRVGRGENGFRSILDQVAASGYHPVLLMDAFDNITRNKAFGPEFFSFLRVQAIYDRVSYVTASLEPLDKVCHGAIEGSPFFNIFTLYPIEGLTLEAARALVTVPSQRIGCPFTEDETAWLLHLTGSQPFFIQRACNILFEAKYLQEGNSIELADIEKAIYSDLLIHFEDIWTSCNEMQQAFLQHDAKAELETCRTVAALRSSALFCTFVQIRHNTHSHPLTYHELEEALEHINDIHLLGESKLKDLHLVAHRLKSISSPSLFDKGRAVRTVLEEVFALQEGQSVRNHEAEDWKEYNILYYRYFKYRMNHRNIIQRLAFDSPRTYYRKRIKAITTLLNNLLDKEASFIDSSSAKSD